MASPSLEMFMMSVAPGIQIYHVTALSTPRGLELDDLYGSSNPSHAKILQFLSTSSNTESCLLRYSLITSFSPRAHLPCTNISHLSLAPRTPRGPVLETLPCPVSPGSLPHSTVGPHSPQPSFCSLRIFTSPSCL